MMVVREGDGAAVARLLAAGADPNALVAVRTPSGKSVQSTAAGDLQLAQASAEGDAAAVTRLLAAGGDPNASMAFGRNAVGELVQTTALCVAAEGGRLEAARLLLEAGADPSRVGGDGTTPLIFAVLNGQLEVLRLLLARGAAMDTVHSGTGSTAFHHACSCNLPECAEVLVRAGCDVGLKDISGQTGREVAEGKGHAAVVARLRAVVAEQLRVAQAAGPAPAPIPAALAGDGGLADQVRKMPSWPRSWGNCSLLQLYSHRNTWANLHLLGQPNTFLARS
jgi:ankyrin repeat protein